MLAQPRARWILRLGLYAVVAALVTGPAWIRGDLLGDPTVDVWNHAWGWWWFAESLGQGTLPWRTGLLGHPAGGVLWFPDPLGALAGLPWTLLFGPAIAWNLVLTWRVLFAALAADLLAEEVSGPGPHTVVAGVALSTSPFLWCELADGISEATSLGWVALALWALARAFRTGTLRDHVLLGAIAGTATVASPYFGVSIGVLGGAWWIWRLVRYRRGLPGGLLAAGVALALAIGPLIALSASLAAPDALAHRPEAQNLALAVHNAVDPREYVVPGFVTLDLAAVYGETLVHSGYLRVALLVLAGLALVRHPRRALPWALLAAGACVLGLGPYLFWDHHWVTVGNRPVPLPFLLLQRVAGLAATHPLRLSVVAQVAAACLGALALSPREGGPGRAVRLRTGLAALAALAAIADTIALSRAPFPLPVAPAAVPPVYATIAASEDPRGVLDLPPEVDTTMRTSRYLWFQTVHGRPVPWGPDVRAGSSGDPEALMALPHPQGHVGPLRRIDARPLPPSAVLHLRRHYGWILLHEDLDARVANPGASRAVLEAALGAPVDSGGILAWTLPGAP
ncbi:MAG: hypothetical protein JXB39_02060 [Deltaproteobacteria bacterium]|nr:hypothetical protein [Deltaproteobacteria bacterium]